MDQAPLEHTGTANPSRVFRRWAVVVLLACHGFLAVTSVLEKSNTFDELIHLTAGYSYWTRNDYRLQPENGNLPQRWAALPLLLMDLNALGPQWDANEDSYMAAQVFFFELGNDADRMLFGGRIMIIVLSVLLGLIIYHTSHAIFGFPGALISLVLFTFSPTLIAHGRLTTSDLAAALFFLVAVNALWGLLHRVRLSTVMWAGVATAGLMLSKMSGILIVPMVILMVAVRLWRGSELPLFIGRTALTSRWRQALVMATACLGAALVCLAVVWCAYGFRFTAAVDPPEGRVLSFKKWDAYMEGAGSAVPLIIMFRENRWLPEAYLYGVSDVLFKTDKRMAFMDGHYGDKGWWQFFPFCFAVKTPLGTIAALLLALVGLAVHRERSTFYALYPFGILVGVYLAAAVSSAINIGHRHILPIYPPLFVVAGAAGCWFEHGRILLRLLPILAMSVLAAESLSVWPHYLAFFNIAAGGPSRGYRLLVDSSLDWGQDLIGLKHWLEAQNAHVGGNRPVYLAYFGTASPAYYRMIVRVIPARKFPWMRQWRRYGWPFGPGIYCISATELQQVYGYPGGWKPEYEAAYQSARQLDRDWAATQGEGPDSERLIEAWGGRQTIDYVLSRLRLLTFARLCAELRTRDPDAQVGHSILIYEVDADEVNRALDSPPSAWKTQDSAPE